MMQGCASVGHDTNSACGEGKRVSSCLFFYPMIPCKYDGEEQNIYEGWLGGRGVHFKKQSAQQRGILLSQTPTTQWRKEYNGNIPSNRTKK